MSVLEERIKYISMCVNKQIQHVIYKTKGLNCLHDQRFKISRLADVCL